MKVAIVVALATLLSGTAVAATTSVRVGEGGVAPKPADCAAVADEAALKAMNGTGVLGQTYVSGDPVHMGPNHLRVDINDGEYAVDVNVDRACNVLSVSTERKVFSPD